MWTIWVNCLGDAYVDTMYSGKHQASEHWGCFDSYKQAERAIETDEFFNWRDDYMSSDEEE